MTPKISSYCWLILFAALASGLYLVKYKVQDVKDVNTALQQNIQNEALALELLEAEWVYLNRPKRLSALAQKHLPLEPMTSMRVISVTDVPMPVRSLNVSYEAR